MDDDIQRLITLHQTYADNPYILGRLSKIMENLPNMLQHIEQTRQESIERISVLSAKQQQFITEFMTTNQYYYCSTTNLFFKYDEQHYSATTDDEIAHHVWQSMPAEEMIHDWQLSTKRFIVKRVRSRSILRTVPESQTIQSVLDALCPAIFESRDMAKYFLTAMGDRILKKSLERVCIISAKCAWLLHAFKHASMTFLGANAVAGFKHKYGRREYAMCRLIQTNSRTDASPMPDILDMLCVATHYSERYLNADEFLENDLNDYDTYSHISYLMFRSPENVVGDFCGKYLESGDTIMRWKHMHYLWNAYLEQNQLPAIMYLGDLKTELGKRIMFDVDMDAFVGVSSRFLPEIDKFLRFWETTMEYVGDQDEAQEYEMDEMCSLFTKWYLDVKPDANIRERHISDKKMRGLIEFYFPSALTKYVCGYRNVLWDKRRDVKMALELYRSRVKEAVSISIHDMYIWYSRTQRDFTVGKVYFERVVGEDLAIYAIPGTKKISSDWIRGI
jgi:hypothetical protein